MIDVDIPGYGRLQLEHLVLDYNGTLAVDGNCCQGVRRRLTALSENLQVHIITADTFGRVAAEMADVPCKVTVLPVENQDAGKLAYVNELGADRTASMGNGRNDRLMLEASALGVALILGEGACMRTLMAADVVCTSATDALDLLSHPLRLTATLRS